MDFALRRGASVAVKGVDECDWEGVVCGSGSDNAAASDVGVVEEIRFGYGGLAGTIPEAIGLLTNLKVLDLAENAIAGTIPESLYDIKGLRKLYLYKNNLSGTISDRISNWWNM